MTADLSDLTTAHLADACVQLGIEPRVASEVGPVIAGARIAGPAVPVRHAGSVDIFIEVMADAPAGSVLVIDDGGRRDQACIGDLVTGEAKLTGFAGIVVWGCHRDTEEIRAIGLPVFSLGAHSIGPRSATDRDPDALTSARVGDLVVNGSDVAVADDDGVIFIPTDGSDEIAAAAATIRDREYEQARRLAAGTPLFEQLQFADYLERHEADPSYTLRVHLQQIERAIET